ncbi:MAG: hypothetical protein PHS57_07625 [Alphaproteobacteria bacterium]|nr:hypothetical protein [Alphaproteobacteria bacterium]
MSSDIPFRFIVTKVVTGIHPQHHGRSQHFGLFSQRGAIEHIAKLAVLFSDPQKKAGFQPHQGSHHGLRSLEDGGYDFINKS